VIINNGQDPRQVKADELTKQQAACDARQAKSQIYYNLASLK